MWMSLSVFVFLSFLSLDAIEWYVMFAMHVFCKAVLVFLSFSQDNKTSCLVAHENSTFLKNVNRSICVLYLVNGCSFGL